MPDDLGGLAQAPLSDGQDALVDEIIRGLAGTPKRLPPKLFYDEEGCRLFGMITALPEYYPTRTERRLLERHATGMAAKVDRHSALVEYGASDEGKAAFLLATGRFGSYVPIDIAPEALARISARLAASSPDLAVRPVCADFMQPVRLPEINAAPWFGFFPGSTIGNMDPSDARRFLRSVRDALGERARFLVGTDLRKDERTLLAAYDDGAGVTARFNRNMLRHVNRIADASFEPDRFSHRAVWNDAAGRIEMHLVSGDVQTVTVAGRPIGFAAGETIHTENSYKYTRDGFAALAEQSGWTPSDYWTDERSLFGVHLLEATR